MKSKWINYCAIPLCSAVLTIIIGTLFSLLTGYKALEVHLILRLFVWLVNIAVSYCLSVLIFKKCKSVKLLNKLSIILSIITSVILVAVIASDLQCLYLITLTTLFGLWEMIEYFIKKNKKD